MEKKKSVCRVAQVFDIEQDRPEDLPTILPSSDKKQKIKLHMKEKNANRTTSEQHTVDRSLTW